MVMVLISFIIVPSIIIIAPQNITSQDRNAAPANSTTPSHILIYSTYGNSNEELFVPANSSGLDVYPVWHIHLYGSGSFNMKVNGSTVETGYSNGQFSFSYSFSSPGGTHINASVKFSGITYSFNDIITGPLSNQAIESVSVSSSYTGQNQFLTVQPGKSGALMYPHWTIKMESTQNETYSIVLDGQTMASGNVHGNKSVNLNVSGTSASVVVGIGSHVFSFPHEIIATVPIQKFYGPRPPPLVFTTAQYEEGLVKAFIASFFAILISFLGVRNWILEQRKREVMVI